MSISQIGFDQGPQGLSRSRERLDRLASSARIGPSPDSSGGERSKRVDVVRSGSEYHRLAAKHERARVLASTIRTMDGAMEAAITTIDEMKKTGALKPVALDVKDSATFRATVDKLTNSQRGVLVPADVFDMAVRERDAYRKAKGGRV